MENVIPVLFQRSPVGSITVEQSPKELVTRRTPSGFALELPVTVRLGMKSSQAPQPLLSNLSATLYLGLERIGEAFCGTLFFGSVEGDKATIHGTSGSLMWTDTLSALAYSEELRGSKAPQLRMDFRAEICYLLSSNGPRVRSEPCSVFHTAHVSYPTEIWIKMLRDVKIVDYVFLQVPIPSDPLSGWDEVWREVSRARSAFELGTETGWTGCTVAVRRALEAWEKIEPEKRWPETAEERRALTKNERFASLRWSLHQASHPAAHTGDDGWSREEARVMLAALCGLLASRVPR